REAGPVGGPLNSPRASGRAAEEPRSNSTEADRTEALSRSASVKRACSSRVELGPLQATMATLIATTSRKVLRIRTLLPAGKGNRSTEARRQDLSRYPMTTFEHE